MLAPFTCFARCFGSSSSADEPPTGGTLEESLGVEERLFLGFRTIEDPYEAHLSLMRFFGALRGAIGSALVGHGVILSAALNKVDREAPERSTQVGTRLVQERMRASVRSCSMVLSVREDACDFLPPRAR